MSQVLRQSTQVIVVIGPFVDVTDGFTPETGITLSGADEAEILKSNTSTTTDISGATWAAITGCDGWYALTLTTSLTDTVGALTVMVNDDSVCLPVFARFQVIEEAAYDAMYAASADPKADINVASIDANAITATAIASDAITAAKIANGAIDAATFAAGAIDATAIANGAIDAATFAAGAIDAAAIANGAIDAATFAADVDAEILSYIVDDATRIDASSLNTASVTTIPAILVDTAEIGAAGAGLTAIDLPDQTMNITGNITGNLSGSVGSVTGAVGSVTGAVGSVTGLTASDVGAIKAKTDSLTFTVANKLDINVLVVNGVPITGAGTEADPWRPA